MITVIIPAYNSASLIKEAIDSILQQSYRDIELIIINDGSTDNTESIIQSLFPTGSLVDVRAWVTIKAAEQSLSSELSSNLTLRDCETCALSLPPR